MSAQYSQNKVSAAIWPWQRSVVSQQPVQPSLLFSMVTLLVAWVIGSLLYFYEHTTIAIIAFFISTVVFITARFFLQVYAVIERLFHTLSAIVGGSLTWIFLVPFFYICFPIGKMAQILKRKDPMHRRLDPGAGSYWQTCKERESVDGYKRQF